MKTLVEQIQEVLSEGIHQNTKVRQLEGMGSRKARLTVKESAKMIERMLDEKDPSPNPKSEADKMLLMESKKFLEGAMIRLKAVKETRKKKKYEGNDEPS